MDIEGWRGRCPSESSGFLGEQEPMARFGQGAKGTGFRNPGEGGGKAWDLPRTSLLGVAETRIQAKREFARAKRYGFPLTLAVCRVDRLDRLADLYGRDSHALIQRELGRIFQQKSRSTDLVGRLTEDRILWILPHTDEEGALVAAERIRSEVEQLDLLSGKKAIRISLSVGISVHHGGETLFLDTILTLAETALERAQALGGNRCELERVRGESTKQGNGSGEDPGGEGEEGKEES